jgi:hypothetical protein
MEMPMAMERPKAALVLDAELRERLESLANSRFLPAGLVCRAKIILCALLGKRIWKSHGNSRPPMSR